MKNLFLSLVFLFTIQTAFSGCIEPVYPPQGMIAKDEGSYQNPVCRPGGGLFFNEFSAGYNKEGGKILIHSLDKNSGQKSKIIGNGVVNVGQAAIAAKSLLTYSCSIEGKPDGICFKNFFAKQGIAPAPIPGADKEQYFEPTLSPDGSVVAFEASKGDSGGRICTIQLTSGQMKKNCLPGVSNGKQPGYSPDGKHLVYQEHEQLFLVDLDKQGLPKSSPKALGQGSDASFSPDGKKLIFSCEGSNGETLCTCNLDGTFRSSIPGMGNSTGYAGAVSWCADGYAYYEFSPIKGDPEKRIDGKTSICRVQLVSNKPKLEQQTEDCVNCN